MITVWMNRRELIAAHVVTIEGLKPALFSLCESCTTTVRVKPDPRVPSVDRALKRL